MEHRPECISVQGVADLLGIELSPASVERLLKDAGELMEDPYIEILGIVDRSPVRWADETGWHQAGCTPRSAKRSRSPTSPAATQATLRRCERTSP